MDGDVDKVEVCVYCSDSRGHNTVLADIANVRKYRIVATGIAVIDINSSGNSDWAAGCFGVVQL